MARAYHTPPSELLGLRGGSGNDSYLAFAIDRAVWTFGTCVEADMHEAESDPRLERAGVKRAEIVAARQRVWDEYMSVPEYSQEPVKAPPPKGRFADPAAFVQSR